MQDQSYDCVADVQTMVNIVNECPLRYFREGIANILSPQCLRSRTRLVKRVGICSVMGELLVGYVIQFLNLFI